MSVSVSHFASPASLSPANVLGKPITVRTLRCSLASRRHRSSNNSSQIGSTRYIIHCHLWAVGVGTDLHSLQPPRNTLSSPTTQQRVTTPPAPRPLCPSYLPHLICLLLIHHLLNPIAIHHLLSPIACPTNSTPLTYSPQPLPCHLKTTPVPPLLPQALHTVPLPRSPNPRGFSRINNNQG